MAIENDDLLYVYDTSEGTGKKIKYENLKSGTGGTGEFGYWNRSGTTLSPANSGDNLDNIGSATFAGEVTCNVTSAAQGLRIRGQQTEGQPLAMFIDTVGAQRSRLTFSCSDDGVTLASRNTAGTGRDLILDTGTNDTYATGAVKIGGASSASPQISLNAIDGSAEFAGNVGVGDGTGSPTITIAGADAGNSKIHFADSGSLQAGRILYSFSDNNMQFWTDATYRAVINGNGNFFIGGTTASPNISLNADGSAMFAGKVTSVSTEDTDADTTLVTKDYVDANASYWDRSGTTLSPINSGDDLDNINNAEFAGTVTAKDVVITNVKNAMSLATDSAGKIVPASTVAPAPLFTWNAETDDYDRTDVGFRDIKVQARMRRCLMQDDGTVTYLDADDSTKLAGDWIRLCETTELDMEYTGTHGAEIFNTRLRDLAPTWAPGTHHQGELVTHNGKVWECLATTTTATPASGTAAATLDGTAGQVMVEIPTFSVCHETDPSGSFFSHDWGIMLGASTLPNYVTHPAFIRPDGSIRKAIYIGAYQGTGTDGNGSFSGVNNTTGMIRSESRTACFSRGTGWHQLGYAEYNAVQHLLLNEYQDINSQRVLGNGAMLGYIYEVTTGLSDSRGNRCENSHTPAGSNTDYVSYRGLENIYGRAWQSVDGLNVNDRAVYVCTDPSKWADDTITDYKSIGSVPSSSGNYIRDVSSSGVYLLPQSVAGASATTFVGDAIYTTTGWRVGSVGGGASLGNRGGLFPLFLIYASDYPDEGFGGRLCYAD